MVREIRDRQYELLKDKSQEEILQFYRQEAQAANAEAERLLEQRSAAHPKR